jgi:hypothetical protein
MIRSTMTAVPKRVPVLWAKLIVFVAIIAISMLVVSFAAFYIGQAVISTTGPAFSLGSPGALRVIVGTGLYLTLPAMREGSETRAALPRHCTYWRIPTGICAPPGSCGSPCRAE